MPTLDSFEEIHPADRAAWRAWLQEYHARSPGIWLIYDKKSSGRSRLEYADAVEEALCFGWIDSKPNKIDETRYKQVFSPRNPKSIWSKLNKTRVEKLIATGRMMPAGMAKIELAKQNGSWTLLDAVEEGIIPPDLDAALDAIPAARTHFLAFPMSIRKGILWQIESAKRPETRAARIAEVVRLAAENIRAFQYTPKPKT